MTAIRIGVTGSGFMGRTHVEAARRLESAEIVAVAGGSRAPQLAADYGIDCEPDAKSLIGRPDIDAIVISTPHHVHCGEAILAAKSGKHVLVEKPMATSVEDCLQMTVACRDRGLVLAVGYQQRFREANRRARDLIRDGAIGKVRCIQMSALHQHSVLLADSGFGGNWGWWKDPRSIAHLINSGPHNIDLCRWFLGAEVATAAAHCGTYREESPNENTTMALLTFSDGTACTYWSTSILPDPGFDGEAFHFRILGDDGLIDLDPYSRIRVTRNGEWETAYEQPPVGHEDSASAFGLPRMQAYCDQMQAFIDTIHGQTGEQGTPADGIAGVTAVLAMLESSASGRTVDVAAGAR